MPHQIKTFSTSGCERGAIPKVHSVKAAGQGTNTLLPHHSFFQERDLLLAHRVYIDVPRDVLYTDEEAHSKLLYI